MGRKRTNAPDWLPNGVIIRRGWYKYRQYLGRENGTTQFGPELPITKTDCTPQQFFLAYEKLTQKQTKRTLNWLLDKYNSSPSFKKRTRSTQKQYLANAQKLCEKLLKSSSGAALKLGNIPLEQLTKPKLQRYLDREQHPVGANRRIQYLSSAWSWAENRFEKIPPNPCKGLEKNEEKPRDRYPEDWEYAVVYLCAASMRNPMFAPAMEFAYLCRARRDEVFSLTDKDLLEDGVFLKRSKGSNSEITLWSPRLTAAVEFCKNINPKAPTPIKGRRLLHDKKGLKYTKNALDSAWQRVIKKAKETGATLPLELCSEAKRQGAHIDGQRVYLKDSFTFHDIKAKGATDHAAENAGNHKSKKMEAVYQRKPKAMEATR